MNSTRLALAFTAGMITTVNPCGFALLPAYLTYFLGLDQSTDADARRSPVARALWVSLAVTLGFVTVFGVVGLVWSSISGVVAERLPYVTMVVGVGLVVLGVAVVRGFEPVVRLPKLQLSSEGRELSSMFLYGVTYAVASLSCSIGVFISIVSTTLDDGDVVSTLLTFVVYALGMGAALAVLTVAVALARTGVVTAFRRVLPHVQMISGVLMVLAGIFVGNQLGRNLVGSYIPRCKLGDHVKIPRAYVMKRKNGIGQFWHTKNVAHDSTGKPDASGSDDCNLHWHRFSPAGLVIPLLRKRFRYNFQMQQICISYRV